MLVRPPENPEKRGQTNSPKTNKKKQPTPIENPQMLLLSNALGENRGMNSCITTWASSVLSISMIIKLNKNKVQQGMHLQIVVNFHSPCPQS